jgi:hypothetical protein
MQDAAGNARVGAEGCDQLFVDGIVLVEMGEAVLQPKPLHDRGLEQGGGRVGIQLQKL